MTERPYLPVASIEAAPGTKPEKYDGRSASNRGYEIDIVYVLEDGRRIPRHSRHRLLRDAKAELASLPTAPRHMTSLQLNDEGDIHLVRTSVRIGG
jgi:hypothetical protein